MAPKIRTLVVLHLAERSGSSQSLAPVIEWLGETGDVCTIAPAEGQALEDYSPFSSVSTLPIEAITLPRNPADLAKAMRRSAREIRELRRTIRRQKPDLVIVLTSALPTVLLAARLEGVPTVVRVAELYSGQSVTGRRRGLWSRALLRFTATMANSIVCCSETVAAQFAGRPGIFVAYSPVDPKPPNGNGFGFRREHGLIEADPLIAVIGNLSPGRGQDLAIRAMPRILESKPSAVCVLAGAPHPRRADREYADELRTLTKDLGIERSVNFVGFTPRVEDVYAACDIVLNPARFNETFGRVACEALVAGRPVVSTRAGAISEVLRDGQDALLVDVDDLDGIARALLQVVADKQTADRLIENGREWVRRRYNVEESIRSFATSIEAALALDLALRQ